LIATQYSVQLPADYNMDLIRGRIRDRGAAFDHFPGLGLKAFLITEKARGATTNRYAPFYLWNDVSGTNDFLFGDGFAGVTESFGRPLVEHWLGTDVRLGDTARSPRSATREDQAVAELDLATLREAQREWLESCARDDRGLYAAAVALDPHRWQVVRFALWHVAAAAIATTAAVTAYEVLHLSVPGLQRL
jgi:hypothetical protein